MASQRSSRSPARRHHASPRASGIQQAHEASQPATVHQLKITLRDIRPPIWRRVQVSSAASLAILHAVLQQIFAWTDSHLHEFEADRRRFGPPQLDVGWGEDDGVEDERRVTLGRVTPRKGAKLLYRYDLGDDWQHDIVVEDILPADPTIHSTHCLDGRRAAPPEDCGGPFGYAELLDALADPTRKDHAERLEWPGDRFDPEAFDVAAMNRALARIR